MSVADANAALITFKVFQISTRITSCNICLMKLQIFNEKLIFSLNYRLETQLPQNGLTRYITSCDIIWQQHEFLVNRVKRRRIPLKTVENASNYLLQISLFWYDPLFSKSCTKIPKHSPKKVKVQLWSKRTKIQNFILRKVVHARNSKTTGSLS